MNKLYGLLSLIFITSTLITSPVMASSLEGSGVQWRQISRDLERALETRESIGWDKAGDIHGNDSRSRRMQRIMSNVVGVLADAPASETIGRINQIRNNIQRENRAIDELRMEAMSAPRERERPSSIMEFLTAFFQKTKADYEVMMDEHRAQIAIYESQLQEVKSEFGYSLASLGMNLTPDQVNALLSTVTAEEIVEMYAVYENLKSINADLAAMMEESGESMEVARRYYGLYAVLMETALFMHQEFIIDVRRYHDRLDEIIREAARLSEDANRQLRSNANDPQARSVLQANLESQALTIRAAERYKEYLNRQAEMVSSRELDLRRRLALSINTYQTVMVSSRLLDMMRMQARDFNAIMSMEVPPLRPFESIEMQREFERLSEELRAGV